LTSLSNSNQMLRGILKPEPKSDIDPMKRLEEF